MTLKRWRGSRGVSGSGSGWVGVGGSRFRPRLPTGRAVVVLVFRQDETESKAEGDNTGDDEESGYNDKTPLGHFFRPGINEIKLKT